MFLNCAPQKVKNQWSNYLNQHLWQYLPSKETYQASVKSSLYVFKVQFNKMLNVKEILI